MRHSLDLLAGLHSRASALRRIGGVLLQCTELLTVL